MNGMGGWSEFLENEDSVLDQRLDGLEEKCDPDCRAMRGVDDDVEESTHSTFDPFHFEIKQMSQDTDQLLESFRNEVHDESFNHNSGDTQFLSYDDDDCNSEVERLDVVTRAIRLSLDEEGNCYHPNIRGDHPPMVDSSTTMSTANKLHLSRNSGNEKISKRMIFNKGRSVGDPKKHVDTNRPSKSWHETSVQFLSNIGATNAMMPLSTVRKSGF